MYAKSFFSNFLDSKMYGSVEFPHRWENVGTDAKAQIISQSFDVLCVFSRRYVYTGPSCAE